MFGLCPGKQVAGRTAPPAAAPEARAAWVGSWRVSSNNKQGASTVNRAHKWRDHTSEHPSITITCKLQIFTVFVSFIDLFFSFSTTIRGKWKPNLQGQIKRLKPRNLSNVFGFWNRIGGSAEPTNYIGQKTDEIIHILQHKRSTERRAIDDHTLQAAAVITGWRAPAAARTGGRTAGFGRACHRIHAASLCSARPPSAA